MSKTLAVLRLLRAGALFSPAADIVAGLTLAGGAWSIDAVRAALASVCLYGAGMVLNDFFDLEEDRKQRPERPLPQGVLKPITALALGLGLLGSGIALAPAQTRVAHIAIAVLVLGYDTILKRKTLTAVATMGVLRGLNLLTGAILVVGGTDGLDGLTTPSLAAAGCYGLIIATITLLGRLEDLSRANPRMVASLFALPPVLGLIALTTTPNGALAASLALVPTVLFGRFCRARGRDWPPQQIRRGVGLLLLGCMLYDALLCVGAGRYFEAGGVILALLAARRISRLISWT